MYRFVFILIIFMLGATFSAFSRQQNNLDQNGRALHGYDPVSYFTAAPVKGNDEISYGSQDGMYLFATEENRREFISNQEKYRFAYGGYCAWAMLSGNKVDVDPERFKVIDGVVYLFYTTFFTDTLDKWNRLANTKSEQSLIIRADEQWRVLNGN